MKEFNLSGWALKHQALVLYALLALILAGIFSYTQLAQKEDPDFTFRVMTIKLLWPGADAREVEQQVTRLIETRLQATPWLESLDSYSKSGEVVIFVTLKDAMPPAELPRAWGKVRKIPLLSLSKRQSRSSSPQRPSPQSNPLPPPQSPSSLL